MELLKLVYELILSKVMPELWQKLYSKEANAERKEKVKDQGYYDYRHKPGKEGLLEAFEFAHISLKKEQPVEHCKKNPMPDTASPL